MIQPNELRIGSWVNFLKYYPVKITADHIKSISEYDNSYYPIQLTAEVLQKCGFDLVSGLYWTNWKISLEQMENDPERFEVSIDKGVTQLDITIQYLHQLQNLYFALTGRELEVRL